MVYRYNTYLELTYFSNDTLFAFSIHFESLQFSLQGSLAMNSPFLTILILFLPRTNSSNVPWNFLSAFDKSVLDWINYSIISIDLDDAFIDIESISSYFEFNSQEKYDSNHFALKVMETQIAKQIMGHLNCSETKGKFVKNPDHSVLVFDKAFSQNDLKWNLFPCLFPLQPYFYILTENETNIMMYEIQVYSKSITLIGSAKTNDPTNIEYFHNDPSERRSDMKGTVVTLKNVAESGAVEFMKDMFYFFQHQFNLEAN